MHTLQRQRDPTKDKRLWLVLDGIVRAWADCKDGQGPLPSGSSQASCGAGGNMQIGFDSAEKYVALEWELP